MLDPPTCGDCQPDRADLALLFEMLLTIRGTIPRKTLKHLRSLAARA